MLTVNLHTQREENGRVALSELALYDRSTILYDGTPLPNPWYTDDGGTGYMDSEGNWHWSGPPMWYELGDFLPVEPGRHVATYRFVGDPGEVLEYTGVFTVVVSQQPPP
jgi:hypothetical protein